MKKPETCLPWKTGAARGAAIMAAMLVMAGMTAVARADTISVDNAKALLIDGAANGYRIEVYMDIENAGGADRLYAVRSDLSRKAVLSIAGKGEGKHEGHHDGMAMPDTKHAETMALELPASAETKLTEGGSHIMMVEPASMPAAGTVFPVTLFFEKAGKITVDVTMQSAELAQQPVE